MMPHYQSPLLALTSRGARKIPGVCIGNFVTGASVFAYSVHLLFTHRPVVGHGNRTNAGHTRPSQRAAASFSQSDTNFLLIEVLLPPMRHPQHPAFTDAQSASDSQEYISLRSDSRSIFVFTPESMPAGFLFGSLSTLIDEQPPTISAAEKRLAIRTFTLLANITRL
ncbi:MAG: hypothetical protein NUV75_12570 [Gallionella sp.]|nr:hypothetical protein [Gallionella sp.]